MKVFYFVLGVAAGLLAIKLLRKEEIAPKPIVSSLQLSETARVPEALRFPLDVRPQWSGI